MNTENGKELDFVVYEPVRRSDTNLTHVSNQLPQTKKFSGLYNRGNTCYLNSLIQILFLTPEFRNNILSWKYNESIHGKKEDCIPFQLQKLFARMKLRCRDSESTEGLTKSFQWDHHQLLEQHDIQELCRVLFEAIEISLSEIEGNFIIDLFQGSSISVVKCLKCSKESVKKDYFMDISLPIRNEFEKIYNTSLEMAFKNFLKEEKLCGSEQYMCESCGEKVDALKYLKFTKLPKILFLQMNRFEYDIYTEGRKKICDRVTYPMILNMNPFLKDYSCLKEEITQEKLKYFEKREELSNSFTENEELMFMKFSQMSEQYIKEGGYVYELYAVVVHSGSARSGHYYSYIKAYDDNNWYRFEDSSVYESSVKCIENTFGENNNNGATGYILMYKQMVSVTSKLNSENSLPDIKIEDHKELFEDIVNENILLKEEEEKQKEKLNSMQVKFIYDDKIANILIKRSNFIRDLKSKVMKEFKLNPKIDPNNVRIRSLNTQTFQMQEAFVDESKTLEELRIVSVRTYTLEIKNENESFEEFDPDIIYLNICLWQSEFKDLDEKNFKFDKVKVNSKICVKEFKDLIYKYFNIDSDKDIVLFKKVEYASNNYTIHHIFEKEEDLSKEFQKLNLGENSKLYLEIKSQNFNDISQGQFVKYFENNSANVIVKFNFPVFTEVDHKTKDDSKSIKTKKVSRITFNSYKFDNQIEIKSSKTLIDLKSRISEVLNIPQEKFIIKKNTHNGVELKNLQDTIDKYTNNTINIYVEYGNPQRDSEIKINLFSCEYDFSTFMIYPYKLIDQGLFIADLNWTVDELKQNLLNELKKRKIEVLNSKESEKIQIEEFFLREYKNERPAKIFQNQLILGKDLQFVENKKIILQKYTESKIEFLTSPNSFQVSVREWDPSNWIVHTPIEIHLAKGMTFVEIVSVLSTLYPHIEMSNISATKIGNEFNIYMDDIRKLKFDNLYENCDYVIDKFPFFISSDGFMLLIKDDSKQSRDPTEEEIRILCRPKLSNSRSKRITIKNVTNELDSLGHLSISNGNHDSKVFTGNVRKTNGVNKNKIKEKGVVIKVKKNEINKNSSQCLNGVSNIDDSIGQFPKNGNEENYNQSEENVNDEKEHVHHENSKEVGRFIKNGKPHKNFEIEILTKNFNHECNSKVDLSEYEEVFDDSNSNSMIQDKNNNK